MTPTSAPVRSRRCFSQPGRRGVGIDREQDDGLRLRRVRRVDARRAADVAVAGARDQERRADANELGCLVEDDLDPARILVSRDLASLLRRLDAVEGYDAALDLRDGLLRDDDDVSVRELRSLGDERREVVSLAQLRQAFDGRHGEAGPDVLDEDERRVVLVPQAVQLLERDEAHCLVEGAGRVVAAGVRPRRAERLDVEVRDTAHSAPRLGRGDERPPDAFAVLRTPDAHDVDLGRSRRVLLEAEEAERPDPPRASGASPRPRCTGAWPPRSRTTRAGRGARLLRCATRSAGSWISTTCVTGAR